MKRLEPVHASPPSCPGDFLCPLSRVVAGTAVRIKRLPASPEITHRLRELGFCEDQQITLLSHTRNFICLVCNARLAISSQLADAILVTPLPGETETTPPCPRKLCP